jgi:hypothetical protein
VAGSEGPQFIRASGSKRASRIVRLRTF